MMLACTLVAATGASVIQARVRGRSARRQVGARIKVERNAASRLEEYKQEHTQRRDQLARRFGIEPKRAECERRVPTGSYAHCTPNVVTDVGDSQLVAQLENESQPEPELQPELGPERFQLRQPIPASVLGPEPQPKQPQPKPGDQKVPVSLAPLLPPIHFVSSLRLSHLQRCRADSLGMHPSWLVEPVTSCELARKRRTTISRRLTSPDLSWRHGQQGRLTIRRQPRMHNSSAYSVTISGWYPSQLDAGKSARKQRHRPYC